MDALVGIGLLLLGRANANEDLTGTNQSRGEGIFGMKQDIMFYKWSRR